MTEMLNPAFVVRMHLLKNIMAGPTKLKVV